MKQLPDLRRLALRPLVLLLFLLVFARSSRADEALASRAKAPLTILQMNDVYSIAPVDGGKAGGLARVAAMAQEMRKTGRHVLVTMSGDFLSPSVASSVFKGRQMIEALNAMPLDLATLGNHEFDMGVPVLRERLKEAKFPILIANILDEETNAPIGNAKPFEVRTFGALKVGFIGLCLTGDEISAANKKGAIFLDPFESAAKYLPQMKAAGADVIVAITHLDYADDVKLARQFPQIDLILGGHDHFAITSVVGGTLISKADSDARTIARHDLNRMAPGAPLERHYELVRVDDKLPEEPRVAAVVAEYEKKLSVELDEPVGRTSSPLDAVAENVRSREVALGNLFADAMRRSTGAEIAILNSGSIRSNRVFPPGVLSRRDVLAMHPFGGTAALVEASGLQVLEALNNGVSKLGEAAGRFPQVSGLSFSIDPDAPVGQRVHDVMVNGAPLEPGRTYKVTISDYMLAGGDGYKVFGASKVLLNPESSPLLVSALEESIRAEGTVAPRVEGRVRLAARGSRVAGGAAGGAARVALAKRPIILDTDMGIDSALGLLYLLKSPGVDLRAVTVANGVAEVGPGTENARRILALTGNAAIPVAAGQAAPLQGNRAFPSFWRTQANTLGGALAKFPSPPTRSASGRAGDLIVSTLSRSAQPVTIVAMGPLTNIALALRKQPRLIGKIKEIIVMGGALKEAGNVDKPFVGIKNSVAEWNFYLDPQAARQVLESGAPIRLLPLDATRSLPISPAFVQRVRESRRDTTSELLLSLLDSVNDGIEGGWYYFWDTLAAVVAARPEVAGSYNARLQVETKDGPTLGQTRSVATGGASVRVGEEVNREAFESDFLKTVLD
jgi:5'-nucleotidase